MDNLKDKGWIGVDLDGTLSYYESENWEKYCGQYIGDPIPKMLDRVKRWISEGREVRIITARAVNEEQIPLIRDWLEKYGLPKDLIISNSKDPLMKELWDDRVHTVVRNKGVSIVHEYNKAMMLIEQHKQYFSMMSEYIEDKLTFDDYQEWTDATAVYPDIGGIGYVYPLFGLANELGELLGVIKKVFRDKNSIDGDLDGEDCHKVIKELGDVMWYIAQVATKMGFSLEEVCRVNMDKVNKREEKGTIQGSGDDR